jgi:hypothetical protein
MLVLASFLQLFVVITPANALAAADLVVDNFVVDSDGTDANDARTRALAQGEMEAFKQLITKLNPSKAADIIAKTIPTEVNKTIRGFEVLEENSTPTHYHATLKYNFDPTQIQLLLPVLQPSVTGANAPPAAPAAQPEITTEGHISKAVLVLPVYSEGGKLKLWQDDNKWRTIWYESALESGRGYVIVPIGDLDDRVDVDDTNVANATSATLARLYKRYGVGEIYVLNAYYNQKADPKPTLEVTIRRITPDKSEISRQDYTIHSTEKLDNLMARASNDIAKRLENIQTLNPNKIEYDRLKDINARVNVTNINEWEALRKRLLTHSNIVGVKLTSISFYETTLVITFKGTADMLGKTLVASGLRVMEDGDSLVLTLK